MDYDQTEIPAAYDRGRDHGPEMLALWMDALATHLEGRSTARILDLGCGTGRFTESLAERFNAEVIGIDPATKMLAQAREKQRDHRVRYEVGAAEVIPLDTDSVEVIFSSMTFHHFNDPAQAARECRRVLRDRGSVFVRTATREQIPGYPYVPFFPTSHPILAEVLPHKADIVGAFESADFHLASWEIVTQTIAPGWGVYADKLAAGADSVLARLKQADFEEGLAAIRRHAAHADGEAIVEPIDLFVFR